MRGGGGGLFAVVGMRTQRAAFAGGGQRRLGLPEGGADPTDTYDARAALGITRPVGPLDYLSVAIVDKALRDIRMYEASEHPKRRVWFESARAFLFDDDIDSDWPLTFARICERFDFDVDVAREAIRAQRGSRKRARFNVLRAA